MQTINSQRKILVLNGSQGEALLQFCAKSFLPIYAKWFVLQCFRNAFPNLVCYANDVFK